jgi:hypothetical protein
MNTSILACLTCARNFADHTNAIGWSIFSLLFLIVTLLVGVVFFMVRMARRSDAALDPELRDDPQPAATSFR